MSKEAGGRGRQKQKQQHGLVGISLPGASKVSSVDNSNKHRKNCETALFKVWIVENVFCRYVEVVEVVDVVEVVVVDEVDEVDEVGRTGS